MECSVRLTLERFVYHFAVDFCVVECDCGGRLGWLIACRCSSCWRDSTSNTNCLILGLA